MPGNFSNLAGQLYGAPTTQTTYQSGYTEEGAAIRGLEPTTVPPELRTEGGGFVESWTGVVRAAASVAPAAAGPWGVAAIGASAFTRQQMQDAARENAVNARRRAEEARRQWETGLAGFGVGVATRLQTFGQELASQRATFGGGSQTYFRTMPGTGTSAASRINFPTFRGVTRLTQALRRGRRILTLEDL